MVRTRVFFLAALPLALATHAWAQDLPATLTLHDALKLARSRNPTLAGPVNDVEIAEADRLQATRRPNPALTANSEGYPLFASGPRPAFFDGQELFVRVDQELETAGRRRLRVQSAAASIQVARSLQADEQRRLELAVQRAYLQTVLAKADGGVARAALEDIDRILEIARVRLEHGEIAGGELRRLQVERLRFVDDQFATTLAFRNARSALLALMGFADLGREFDVSGSLTDAPGSLAGTESVLAGSRTRSCCRVSPAAWWTDTCCTSCRCG